MREKHFCDHQNSAGISTGELCRGVSCNPIKMDLFAVWGKRHGIRVHRKGEASSGKCFTSYFLWKTENSPTHCRIINYNAGKEIRSRPTRCGDIRQQEIPKLATCELQNNQIRQRREIIFHRRSPSGTQGRNA